MRHYIRSFFLLSTLLLLPLMGNEKMHFATATDTEHYTWTLNLIASIHQFHEEQLGEIAVYDLGLTENERDTLNTIANVNVYDVEKVNPYIFQKVLLNKKGKVARGWYSWKPVVIKQALERHSEVFYLDSGITVRGPMNVLFQHVAENDYLFIDCGHSLERMTPKPLIEKFSLDKTHLEKVGMSAGFQGLSQNVYSSYVLPLYEMAHEIANFEDDGTCPKGFGYARHDQTLFSIQARLLGLQIQEKRRGNIALKIGGQTIKIRLEEFIEITRGKFDFNQRKKFLRYKSPAQDRVTSSVQSSFFQHHLESVPAL
jgi:hypothetical protein